MHIAIVGNIGAGKTTLANKLAHHFNWEVFLEDVDHNPYLKDFYDDMPRWAFHLQVYFLNSRFRQTQQIKALQQASKGVIQDRTIYEDAHIFAANLHQSGLMTERDYQNYLSLFTSMISMVNPPDLLLYLRADLPKLVAQIDKRNRDYENNIKIDYLKHLNEHYEEWISGYKAGRLLIVDVNNLDYVNNPEDLSVIIDKINSTLFGLF
ncbi:deoxyadenosine/deoxycytidine kinase [Hymenobacter luteus]|uniref:Deoxyadenosine/deoxycytidine kinase n=2 Tax=Hymenobacter TaxID=89966 RepID=A0A7W9T1P6_9BACT|nr:MULTISPECIES: deoxynucleoside kinase [Hymenobacter]MBB4600750.1 deoxyadenosine/deoxycytidine kinase [Hymenobacter latericoloratus]MBB6059043.1 deoxyadenosine/deoxycytidine kinase [Hymenobacter luteus]